jgi:threonine dehydrogenase-like Zn-dependent dehydrogenase
MAEQCGAAIRIRDDGVASVLQQVQVIVGSNGVERVIEAMGTQQALDIATGVAGIRARVAIAGYHQDGDRRIDLQSWNWRGLDIINAHERDPREYVRGVRDALNAVAAGVLDPSPLLTHRFPLGELDSAFRMMEERPDGFLKAVVMAE